MGFVHGVAGPAVFGGSPSLSILSSARHGPAGNTKNLAALSRLKRLPRQRRYRDGRTDRDSCLTATECCSTIAEIEQRDEPASALREALGDFVVLALRARRAARRVSAETRAEVRA